MDKILTKFEKDVAVMKRLMAPGDDDIDEMVVNDTSPNFLVVVPVVLLNVVYPDAYFEGEVPQGTSSDIDSNNNQFNPRMRKASFSGGAHDEVGSSTIGDPSTPLLPREENSFFYLNELAKIWRLPIEEVREIMLDYKCCYSTKERS
ncbi:unnamed protein product [Lactuca saligna]|uniref:Uncharacterized protein n=1 Tax=Lactuca saligna TaxID=75948 RepID=A0AA36EPR8_LACSI|nr:unnamed protein product [Lactuca saligna]